MSPRRRTERAPKRPSPARAGVSLLEVGVASTIFVGRGYVLALSVRVSDASKATVEDVADANASMRETTTLLRDELRAARASTLSVVDAGDGFSRGQLQTALPSTGGNFAWGAYERELDVDEASCYREGWSIEYVADPTAGDNPPLERRVLNAGGSVVHTKTLATSVSQFSVTEAGDVWVVELTAVTEEGERHEEFDVRTRDGQ